MKTEIIKLSANDVDLFTELMGVFKIVFEWDNFSIPDSSHLKKVIGDNHFIAFIASVENKVVGGFTAYVLERYDTEKPAAYIYDLAILKEFQRKGIGKQLISTFYEYCRANNFSEMFVQAETDDIHAVNFYRTTPIGGELRAIHFTYPIDMPES